MSYKSVLVLLLLLSTALLFDTRSADACSCAGKSTVLAEYDWAKTIVIAQVMSVEKAAESARLVDNVKSTKLIVEKVFKGSLKTGDEMTFAQGGGADCIWTFSEKTIGKRFLFYLSAKGKGEGIWYASICGRSRNLEYAADDLSYLENMTKVRGKSRLSGTLSYYEQSPIEDQEPIHRNLSGTKVRIIGEKKTVELITNQDGVYEIYDLPAGKYVIEPEISDGWKIDYTTRSVSPREDAEKDNATPKKPTFRVVVESGKHAFFDFNYGANNVVRGKVLDVDGNGMKDVCLDILPAQGKVANYFREFDCTDKDGSFEIAGIPPGSYVIAVNKDGKISSSEPFPTFYYPNVFEREKAAVINIGLGHVIEGINIYVPKMEERVAIDGFAFYSDGKPVVEGWIEFGAANPPSGIEGKSRAKTDSKGRFSMKILKGLKGKLYGEVWAYSGKYENCPKVEELIRQAGDGLATLRTNALEIQAEGDVTGVELRYPFPNCKECKVR